MQLGRGQDIDEGTPCWLKEGKMFFHMTNAGASHWVLTCETSSEATNAWPGQHTSHASTALRPRGSRVY
jgi:hypothetical protein